jgi:hypothetical protein
MAIPIELTVALLLLYPPAWAYQTILVSCIALVRSTLLSLCCTWSTRHATVLTQSDFRVSEWELLGTSAWAGGTPGSCSMRAVVQDGIGNAVVSRACWIC